MLLGEELCQMSLEGVVMVKKEGEITFGKGTSICKGLGGPEIWQEMKLGGQGQLGGKGLVSHSKKLGSCPEDSLLTFSQEETPKDFEKSRTRPV